jgi:hypothetical protein
MRLNRASGQIDGLYSAYSNYPRLIRSNQNLQTATENPIKWKGTNGSLSRIDLREVQKPS